MKPPRFQYHAPSGLAQALELIATLENARVLAGGQSLMPMLNFRVAAPDHLIDLNEIRELDYIREEGGDIAIGAMTRQRTIEFSSLVAERLPLLAEAIRSVGHRQTRNRGTIGGSLCHLDPSAELPTIATAMDATIVIASRRGKRSVPMRDFPVGYMTTTLAADEVLTEIRFKPWTGRCASAFVEYARRHGDFAIASVAALVEADDAGRIKRASMTLGGVVAAPVRWSNAEQVIIGAKLERAVIDRASETCGTVDALGDAFVPAWYRQHLAKTLSQRALERVAAQLGGAV